MPSGGRRSTTWPKGKKPPTKKPKGAVSEKTKIKRGLGLEGWEQLRNFIEGEGASKLVKEMKQLKGQTFVHAMQLMSEYVKPKLRRVDAHVKASVNLADEPIEFS